MPMRAERNNEGGVAPGYISFLHITFPPTSKKKPKTTLQSKHYFSLTYWKNDCKLKSYYSIMQLFQYNKIWHVQSWVSERMNENCGKNVTQFDKTTAKREKARPINSRF